MIYCFGKRNTYEAKLSQPQAYMKLGRGSIDPEGNAVLGGAVFRIRQDAENFLFRMGRQGRERAVFGIEADFSGSTADIKRHSIYSYTETNTEYPPYYEGYTDHAKIDFMGTIRGRIGVSLNNNRALLYATAGGAFAHGVWDTYYLYDHVDYGTYYDADWRGEDWRWGWVGGFGFEYALNCHWSLRGEGLYYWFAEDTTGINGPAGAYYADPANGYSYKYTFADSFWTYRVGLNYKFTGFFGGH